MLKITRQQFDCVLLNHRYKSQPGRFSQKHLRCSQKSLFLEG